MQIHTKETLFRPDWVIVLKTVVCASLYIILAHLILG